MFEFAIHEVDDGDEPLSNKGPCKVEEHEGRREVTESREPKAELEMLTDR